MFWTCACQLGWILSKLLQSGVNLVSSIKLWCLLSKLTVFDCDVYSLFRSRVVSIFWLTCHLCKLLASSLCSSGVFCILLVYYSSSSILYFFFYTIHIYSSFILYTYIYNIFVYICIYNRIHFGSRDSLQACMLSCCSDGMQSILVVADLCFLMV